MNCGNILFSAYPVGSLLVTRGGYMTSMRLEKFFTMKVLFKLSVSFILPHIGGQKCDPFSTFHKDLKH